MFIEVILLLNKYISNSGNRAVHEFYKMKHYTREIVETYFRQEPYKGVGR